MIVGFESFSIPSLLQTRSILTTTFLQGNRWESALELVSNMKGMQLQVNERLDSVFMQASASPAHAKNT